MRRIIILLLVLILASCTPHICSDKEGKDFNLCVIEKATLTGDAEPCMLLPSGGYREWCINNVSTATNSTAPCNLLDEPLSKEYCLRDRFIEWNASSRCAELTVADVHDDCYSKFADANEDWHLCTEMQQPETADECLDRLARRVGDSEACVEMTRTNEGRDPCLFSMSIATLNYETCKEIFDDEARIYCYINIASSINDSSICDEMDEDAASYCHTFLNQIEE